MLSMEKNTLTIMMGMMAQETQRSWDQKNIKQRKLKGIILSPGSH